MSELAILGDLARSISKIICCKSSPKAIQELAHTRPRVDGNRGHAGNRWLVSRVYPVKSEYPRDHHRYRMEIGNPVTDRSKQCRYHPLKHSHHNSRHWETSAKRHSWSNNSISRSSYNHGKQREPDDHGCSRKSWHRQFPDWQKFQTSTRHNPKPVETPHHKKFQNHNQKSPRRQQKQPSRSTTLHPSKHPEIPHIHQKHNKKFSIGKKDKKLKNISQSKEERPNTSIHRLPYEDLLDSEHEIDWEEPLVEIDAYDCCEPSRRPELVANQ